MAYNNLDDGPKTFLIAVLGICGFIGGILAGVLGHPIWAGILIVGSALGMFGSSLFME